jgi:hypothetical protein
MKDVGGFANHFHILVSLRSCCISSLLFAKVKEKRFLVQELLLCIWKNINDIMYI